MPCLIFDSSVAVGVIVWKIFTDSRQSFINHVEDRDKAKNKKRPLCLQAQTILLGGSWVVISGVTSGLAIIFTHIRGLIPF